MRMPMWCIRGLSILALVFLLGTLPACKINVKKNEDESNKNVDIETPVGALHVSEAPDIKSIGLALYPGARPVEKEDDDDGNKKGANVNIATPFFGLKVVAQEFESADSPDKLIAFYTRDLKKFGKVLQCHGSWNSAKNVNMDVGTDKSGESKELRCENDGDGSTTELKVGTRDNQHLVAVKPEGKGSRFALVLVQMHGKDDMI